jgi:hypothetical protein
VVMGMVVFGTRGVDDRWSVSMNHPMVTASSPMLAVPVSFRNEDESANLGRIFVNHPVENHPNGWIIPASDVTR